MRVTPQVEFESLDNADYCSNAGREYIFEFWKACTVIVIAQCTCRKNGEKNYAKTHATVVGAEWCHPKGCVNIVDHRSYVPLRPSRHSFHQWYWKICIIPKFEWTMIVSSRFYCTFIFSESTSQHKRNIKRPAVTRKIFLFDGRIPLTSQLETTSAKVC